MPGFWSLFFGLLVLENKVYMVPAGCGRVCRSALRINRRPPGSDFLTCHPCPWFVPLPPPKRKAISMNIQCCTGGPANTHFTRARPAKLEVLGNFAGKSSGYVPGNDRMILFLFSLAESTSWTRHVGTCASRAVGVSPVR